MENILIVDNNSFFQTEIKALLAARGYYVFAARTGQEAFNITRTVDIDLVLIEPILPDADGLGVIALLRKLKPELLIIVMTASKSKELSIKAFNQGVDGFIAKPIKPSELTQMVDRLLSRRRTYLDKFHMSSPGEENQKLIQQLKSRVQELTVLNKLSTIINSFLDLDPLCERIVTLLGEVFMVEIVSLMLLDEEKQNLFIKAAIGLPEDVKQNSQQKITQGVAGWVFQHRQPLLVTDIQNDPRFKPSFWHSQYRNTSFISVPLIARARTLGVLNVNNKSSGTQFTTRDLNFVTTFATQAALALENAILYSSLEKEVKFLSMITEASRLFTQTTHLKKVMVLVMRKIQEILSVEAASLLLIDEVNQELKFEIALGEKAHLLKDMKVKLGEGIAGWVAKEGKTVLTLDTSEDSRFDPRIDTITHLNTRSILCAPIKFQNKVLGVIQVINKRNKNIFDKEDQRILEALCNGAAIAIRNATLFKALQQQTQKLKAFSEEAELQSK